MQDPIYDDQALVAESPEGTIVLLGCTHAGLINTLRYVTYLTESVRFMLCLAGHLLNVSESRLARTLEALREFDIKKVAPVTVLVSGHRCFTSAFGENFMLNRVGSVFKFG